MTLVAILVLASAFVFIGWRVRVFSEETFEAKDKGATLIQTNFSLFTVIGAGEYGFAVSLLLTFGIFGLSFIVGIAFAFVIAIFISGHIRSMAGNIKPLNPRFDGYLNYSTPDYYAQIGGKSSSALVTITDVLAFIGILLVQLIVGGTILASIADISYTSAVILMAITVSLYSLMGGLKAVFHTDVFQGILMWAALLLAVGYVFLYSPSEKDVVGSISALIRETGGLFDDYTPLVLLVLTVSAAFSGPDIWQRIVTAHTTSISKKSLAQSGLALLIFGFLLLGLTGDIRLSTGALNSDDAFLTYLEEIYQSQQWPSYLSALFAIGLISAFVSTADTSLLLLTTLTQNELRRQGFWSENSSNDSFLLLTTLTQNELRRQGFWSENSSNDSFTKRSKWVIIMFSTLGAMLALLSPGIVDVFGIAIGLLSLIGVPTIITFLGFGSKKTLPLVLTLEVLVFIVVSFFPFTENPLALLLPLAPAAILLTDHRAELK